MMRSAFGLLAVASGGAVGASLRWVVARAVQGDSAFPRGTLVVNVAGCLVFGLAAGLLAGNAPESVRLFVFTGILGGFTTFSAFGSETVILLRDRPVHAALYVGLSVGLGILALGGGQWLSAKLRS